MIYVLAVYDLPIGFVFDKLQRQKVINLGPASIIDAEQAPILLCREETFGHCKSDARYQNIKRGERVGPKLFESGKNWILSTFSREGRQIFTIICGI